MRVVHYTLHHMHMNWAGKSKTTISVSDDYVTTALHSPKNDKALKAMNEARTGNLAIAQTFSF